MTTEAPADRRHVVLPVDETPESMKALTWLFANLHKEGDVIDIVHVVPDEEPGVPVWLGVYEQMVIPENDAEKHVKAALVMIHTKFGDALKESKALYRVHILRGHTNTGGIAEAIAEKADELNAVAIVMAHHQKSMIKTWFLGSVCLDIVSKAKVPLVVIR